MGKIDQFHLMGMKYKYNAFLFDWVFHELNRKI